MKIIAITVSYAAGDDTYDINHQVMSVEAASLLVAKKAKNGLLRSNLMEDSSKISFTIFTSEDGKVFPFFFGIRK